LSRFKHWFQFEEGLPAFSQIHVITQFRDPFDWVEAMHVKPHHSSYHTDLDWKTFVTRPWTMPRYGIDLTNTNTSHRICQEDFYWDEVIPCQERIKVGKPNIRPIYELQQDGSGLPYDSVLDLRRDKIRNFLSISDFADVSYFQAVRYEDMVEWGTAGLIRQLEEVLGVKATCQPFEPQKLRHRKVDPEYIKWMNQHVDWETEALIGYEKRQPPKSNKRKSGKLEHDSVRSKKTDERPV
jgi:hypothetical protein